MRQSAAARNRALTEFATSVNLKLRIRREDGAVIYQLHDAKGEPLCTEYEAEDAAQSIAVYAGSHPSFGEARSQYASATGEGQ